MSWWWWVVVICVAVACVVSYAWGCVRGCELGYRQGYESGWKANEDAFAAQRASARRESRRLSFGTLIGDGANGVGSIAELVEEYERHRNDPITILGDEPTFTIIDETADAGLFAESIDGSGRARLLSDGAVTHGPAFHLDESDTEERS